MYAHLLGMPCSNQPLEECLTVYSLGRWSLVWSAPSCSIKHSEAAFPLLQGPHWILPRGWLPPTGLPGTIFSSTTSSQHSSVLRDVFHSTAIPLRQHTATLRGTGTGQVMSQRDTTVRTRHSRHSRLGQVHQWDKEVQRKDKDNDTVHVSDSSSSC